MPTVSPFPFRADTDYAWRIEARISPCASLPVHPCFGSGLPTAALGNGLCLAVLVYSTAGISGGHLNPAVSAGFIATGRYAHVAQILLRCELSSVN
jgi:hypothetical protein